MNNYLLIGAGGTGSHFIGPALAYLDSWHRNRDEEWVFFIADGDHYEEKNLDRQLFDPQYTAVNKAEVMALMYNRYPVFAIPRFLGKDDMDQLITEGMTVFLGVDNYSVRALVEERASQLNNVVVVNAGNEVFDGSVQLWVRKDGENKTPRLSYGHPEIRYIDADDRATMDCITAASLPGGEQLIIANMTAAQFMLTALHRYLTGLWETGWTELQFDLHAGQVDHIDKRTRRNWAS